VGLTALEWLLLWLAGLSHFDAICHAFSTLATGGFSTRNASLAAFDSPAIEWIVIAFMLLGGINFVLHWQALTGRWRLALRDEELRYTLVVVAAGSALIALELWRADEADAVRPALFQLVSALTTTGYATADFERWSGLAQLVLLQAMAFGAMTGSTAGGLKSMRTLIGLRALASIFVRQLHPQAVSHPVRYAGRRVPDDVLAGIWAFFTAYFLVAFAASAVLAACGYDVVTSVSAALTTLGNVGPGLGEAGPFDNFGHFPPAAKLALCAAMLAGRLELFTVLILFHPVFWRR
jgi:trk system potassium uptake protein TrkH